MNDLQEAVRLFRERNDMTSSVEISVLDAVAEMGEVAKEVLLMTDYGKRTSSPSAELREELGDLLFSVITIANEAGVDLEEALREAISKYQKRLEQGSAGSDNGRAR